MLTLMVNRKDSGQGLVARGELAETRLKLEIHDPFKQDPKQHCQTQQMGNHT
jgi:hypothetical protein